MDLVHEVDVPSQAQTSKPPHVTETSSARPNSIAPIDHVSSGSGSGVFSQQQNFLSLDVDPQGEYEEMFRSSSEEEEL